MRRRSPCDFDIVSVIGGGCNCNREYAGPAQNGAIGAQRRRHEEHEHGRCLQGLCTFFAVPHWRSCRFMDLVPCSDSACTELRCFFGAKWTADVQELPILGFCRGNSSSRALHLRSRTGAVVDLWSQCPVQMRCARNAIARWTAEVQEVRF